MVKWLVWSFLVSAAIAAGCVLAGCDAGSPPPKPPVASTPDPTDALNNPAATIDELKAALQASKVETKGLKQRLADARAEYWATVLHWMSAGFGILAVLSVVGCFQLPVKKLMATLALCCGGMVPVCIFLAAAWKWLPVVGGILILGLVTLAILYIRRNHDALEAKIFELSKV